MTMDNLKQDASIKDETDQLGFENLDSDIYPCKILKMFLSKSGGGATAVNLHVKTADGKSLQQQLWATSGTKKGCKNYYEGKDGTKHYLPGFNIANAVCLLTVGTALGDMETEPGVEEIFGSKTKVDMIKGIAGEDVTLGVIKQKVDKNVKNDDGEYVPSGETRMENEIDKVFRTRDNLTTTEIRAGLTVPEFHDKWLEKWKGEVKDRSTDSSGASTGAAPTKATGAAAAPDKLFK